MTKSKESNWMMKMLEATEDSADEENCDLSVCECDAICKRENMKMKNKFWPARTYIVKKELTTRVVRHHNTERERYTLHRFGYNSPPLEDFSLCNQSFLNKNASSADESSAKVLFKHPSTTIVYTKT